MIALGWLRGRPQRWKTYVANRVEVIQGLTAVEYWRHCRSAENPADLLTRGVHADVLISSSLWFRGPAWLSEQDDPSSAGEDESSVVEPLPEEASAGQVRDWPQSERKPTQLTADFCRWSGTER